MTDSTEAEDSDSTPDHAEYASVPLGTAKEGERGQKLEDYETAFNRFAPNYFYLEDKAQPRAEPPKVRPLPKSTETLSNVDAIRAKRKKIQAEQQEQRMRSAANALIPKEDTGT